MLLRVQTFHESSRVVPFVVDHEVHVFEFLGTKVGEDLEIFSPHLHRLTRSRGSTRRASFERLLTYVLDVEVELVRRPGARPAAAIDEQLLEIPLARRDFGNTHRPQAVRSAFPTVDHPSAGEYRPCAGFGVIGHRRFLRATVLGQQHERFGQRVEAVSDIHVYRLGKRPLGFQSPHRIPRTLERGKGLVFRSGIPVVARRSNVEVDRSGG